MVWVPGTSDTLIDLTSNVALSSTISFFQFSFRLSLSMISLAKVMAVPLGASNFWVWWISSIKTSYDGSWKVYPNPADVTITIKSFMGSQNQATGRIDNLYGQTVLEFPFNGLATISVVDLPTGIYVIHLGEGTGKLVIAHPWSWVFPTWMELFHADLRRKGSG